MKSRNLYLLSRTSDKNQGLMTVSHLFHAPLPSFAGTRHRHENRPPMGSRVVFPFTIQAKQMGGDYHA